MVAPSSPWRLARSGPHGTKVDQRRPPSMGEFKRGVCVTRGFPGQVVGKQPRLNVKFGALVAVPGGPAGAWHRRSDAEGRSHLPWLEYPQRPAGEMDPLALVQEPFRYPGPRNRPAGGNCQPFQRRERLRAYGPVGVAVLVYPIGHFVARRCSRGISPRRSKDNRQQALSLSQIVSGYSLGQRNHSE